LTDLGLSKDLAGGGELTRPRTCLGTMPFMAPEQCEDARQVDGRCDLYSLAATLYYALTGVVPFPGRGNLAILKKKLSQDFVPARRMVPVLQPHVDEAIRKALSARPADRPNSIQEFMDALGEDAAFAGDARAPDPGLPVRDAKVAAPPFGEERRVAPRYPSELDASCRSLQDARNHWDGEIQDVSTTGVRLQVNRRFEPGSLLTVEFLDAVLGPISQCCVCVRWVRQAEDRQWRLGCSFSRELSEGELNTLLGGHPTVVVHGQG
jgi:serine/threonine protein kinase